LQSGKINCFLRCLVHSIYSTVTRKTTTEKKRTFTSLLVSYQKCKKMLTSTLIIFEQTDYFRDNSLYIITQNLTFMCLCIVKIFHSNVQQKATLHSLFYLETALHVSSGTTTHQQECKQLYLQHLVFVTPLLLTVAVDTVVCVLMLGGSTTRNM
jgi:hypothetical protein